MPLWHGYWLNKADRMPDPILTDIPVIRLDPDREPDTRTQNVGGVVFSFKEGVLRTANGTCGMEDFPPGETSTWFFPFDQVHCVLKGTAEMTYSLASTLYTEEKMVRVGPGDLYLLPAGARVSWKVAPGDPLRRLCFMMPGTPPSGHRRQDKVTVLKH